MPGSDLIIFGQPARARDPRERSFFIPSFGQHGEGVPNFRGDMHQRVEQDLRVMDRVASIPRVRAGLRRWDVS